MRARILSPIAALVAAVGACHNGTSGTAQNPAPAGYQASGADSSAARSIQLQSVNNSGFTGTVMLHPAGAKTSVMIMLVPPAGSSAAGQEHVAHIHTGTCAAPGPVVAPLGIIKGDDKGYNSTSADVSLTAAALADGQHIVAAHATADDASPTIACAPITGM